MRVPVRVLAHVHRLRLVLRGSGALDFLQGLSSWFPVCGSPPASSIVRDASGGPALFTGPGFPGRWFKATAVDAGWCEDNWFMDVVGVPVSGWLRSKA